MNKEKQIEEIQQFATDLRNVSAKVSAIIMEETHEFLSGNHKYNSLKDFHEAHPKGRNLMEAEFLTELGYRKTSDVAREIFEEIEKQIEEALKSNYKVLPQLEFSNELYNSVRGKIDALRGIEGFIAELKKKYTEEQ